MKYRVYTVVYTNGLVSHLIEADKLKSSGGNPEDYFEPGWQNWREEGYFEVAPIISIDHGEFTLNDHYKSVRDS